MSLHGEEDKRARTKPRAVEEDTGVGAAAAQIFHQPESLGRHLPKDLAGREKPNWRELSGKIVKATPQCPLHSSDSF